MSVEQLLGRTVVLIAHPDDECITYGALLQRMREPWVIFATDGAPRDEQFWHKWGSREAYADLRRKEAEWALGRVGVKNFEFLVDTAKSGAVLADQDLYLVLPEAYGLLRRRFEELRPEAIATLAYEGGHPDHDSCNLLAWALGSEFGIPVWEAPLYHRDPEGKGVVQQMIGDDGEEIQPTPEESTNKRRMCTDYASQGDFLGTFKLERETVRPLAKYDYSRPPHEGRLNYEIWGWKMTGSEVSAEFARFVRWWELRQSRAA
jgi:LmbE family N-acetylglucosaminyl deacetylase